ncbi:hypothetical protein [Malacoplasma iowae]|uniref:Uncharacterized protein n=1 Tax=Malacoplasma iowae 695 TaxID=1048830 RepID=A0A6P1LCY4_MALIO|nr:hypothetical protein [Malacoplasma iowae]VEU61934.1 Uncharacterised protein [Mycoplasmopsis fermentans]EGZ31104.1 hypothetical protein GUU_03601 [Malacoplasma iowae 695]QHG90057.1 hypothetical protein EER00_04170 [Malacoplasma iowae 695]WPL36210.1 hypothetical protein QX180_02195 [Malacoplasma iowae]WPL38502.1 hypothetical protein QX181_02915 [Malacoplasma iowae]
MQKLTIKEKQEIRGGFNWWAIGILVSLIIQAVVSLIQGATGVYQVATAKSTGDSSTKQNYSSYTRNNGFLRLSKYPSRTNINMGIL